MHEPFLLALSKPEPDPGGGAAAAFSACLGLALLKKIIRLEQLRPDLSPEFASLWADLLDQADCAEEVLEGLLNEDGKAYLGFAEARAEGTTEKISVALERVIDCPIKIMEQSCQGQGLISEVGRRCKRHLLSDLLVAGEFFLAAVRGAFHIARTNLCFVPNNSSKEGLRARTTEKIHRLQNCCQSSYDTVQEELRARLRSEGNASGGPAK